MPKIEPGFRGISIKYVPAKENYQVEKLKASVIYMPGDEAVFKILDLALKNISNQWTSADYRTGAER